MKSVSLIIPVYNGSLYAERCVEMLKAQDYPELEIIIIDDGSSDDTAELLRKSIGDDGRFTLISQENHGPAFTRNRGIEEASGEYICFCDIDDYIYPDYISGLYDLAKKYDADVACGKVIRIPPTAEIPPRESSWNETCFSGGAALVDLLYRKSLRGYPIAKLIRARLIKDVRFPDVPRIEDLLFNYRMLKKASLVACTDRTVYIYFQTPSSLVRGGKGRNMDKAWRAVTGEILEDPYCDREPFKSAARSHGFVMASDLLSQFPDDGPSAFRNELLKYIKENGGYVFKDRNCKKLNRVMGLAARISPALYLKLCRAYLKHQSRTGSVRKTSV